MSDLCYWIDARDGISSVNEEWGSFAQANDGETLQPPLVIGRQLWDFIRDPDTQHIYRLLHRRIRTSGASVRLSFRCDAPALRRLLELEISATADGGLRYRVRTLGEQERHPVSLLDPNSTRSERFVTVCSWCKRVAAPPRGWLEVEEAVAELELLSGSPPPQLTHGICAECAVALEKTLRGEPAPVPVSLP